MKSMSCSFIILWRRGIIKICNKFELECNPIDPTFHRLLHSDDYLLLSEIYLPTIFPRILLYNQARTSLYEDHLLSFFLSFHIITHVYTSLKKIPWLFAVSLCDPVSSIAHFTLFFANFKRYTLMHIITFYIKRNNFFSSFLNIVCSVHIYSLILV